MALIDKETSRVFKKMRDKIEERMHEICNTRSGRVAKRNVPEYETLRNLLDLVNPFLGISGPTYTESCGIPTTSPKYKLDVKPEQLIGLDDENAADKKAVKEIVKTVRKEITRQVKEMLGRQPVTDCHDFEQGLEEEISRYLREKCSSDNEPSVSEIARHFAEWGATHLKR